jgi:PIN domain nuclease of toxin-antitoxin system
VTVLLDTHVLLWAKISPRLLSPQVAEIVADHTNVIFVSAASVWEIATKVRLGKLPGAEELEQDLLGIIGRSGYTLLRVDPEHALRAGRLTADHGDPFDRMLAAQALANDIPILSRDAKLDAFAIRRIW